MKSDVWSIGISLIELALGRFPFADSDSDDSDLSDLEGTLSPAKPGSHLPAIAAASRNKTDKKEKRKSKGVSLQGGGMTMSILELLQHIVNEPAPKLTPEGRFPAKAEQFVDSCLMKDPDVRPTPKELLVSAQDAIELVHGGVLIAILRTSHGCRQRRTHRSTWLLGQQIFERHPSSPLPSRFPPASQDSMGSYLHFMRRRPTRDPRR